MEKRTRRDKRNNMEAEEAAIAGLPDRLVDQVKQLYEHVRATGQGSAGLVAHVAQPCH